jgi:hypothetical protein
MHSLLESVAGMKGVVLAGVLTLFGEIVLALLLFGVAWLVWN